MPSRTLAPLPSRLILVVVGLAWACGAVAAAPAEPAAAAQAVPTAAGARQFLADADRTLRTLFVDASVAEWTSATDITPAHEAATSAASATMARGVSQLVKAARRFEPVIASLDDDSRRQFLLPRLAAQPAPDDPAQSAELARIASEMTSIYG